MQAAGINGTRRKGLGYYEHTDRTEMTAETECCHHTNYLDAKASGLRRQRQCVAQRL